MYDYSPLLTPVRYTELDNELWCHSYFLRNLCDGAKYPQWSIRDPVSLLKATIDALRREEVSNAKILQSEFPALKPKPQPQERRDAPPPLTLSEACHELGIEPASATLAADARRSYKKLVLALHPDKNSQGRARFEKVCTTCTNTHSLWQRHGNYRQRHDVSGAVE